MKAQNIPDRIIANVRIVLLDEVIHGSVKLAGGCIAAVDSGNTAAKAAEDWEGYWLLPGLIELHTDNLEKHISPRPGVSWPGLPAVLAHDAQVASAGITTVFDSLAIGDVKPGGTRVEHLNGMLDSINTARDHGLLRAEHLLHLRCELSTKGIPDLFDSLTTDPNLRLVSLMDHTPGQRQFVDIGKYREYYQGKYGLSDEEMAAFTARHIENQTKFSAANRRAIVSRCHERGLPIASHDDATPEHVDEAAAEGVTLSEFPTTLVAARAARERGIAVMMGGPNMVRGGSHSGNISARELAREEALDCISSDYVPASMLHAAFLLASDTGWSLPRAIASVSATPAKLAVLYDRGEIREGLRADLVLAREAQGFPVVQEVLSEGRRIS